MTDLSGVNNKKITIKAYDNVGNVKTKEITLKVDNAPPEYDMSTTVTATNTSDASVSDGTGFHKNGQIIYYNSTIKSVSFTIYIDKDDTEISGVDNTKHPVTYGGTPVTATGNVYTVTPDSTKTLKIATTDKVGNSTETPYEITFVEDNNAPTISDTIGITATTGSEGSGYHFDGSTFHYNSTKVTSVTFAPTTDDTNATITYSGASTTSAVTLPASGKLTITAKDNVGNSSEKEITFVIDDNAPNFTVTVSAANSSDIALSVGNGYYIADNKFYFNSSVNKVSFAVAHDSSTELSGFDSLQVSYDGTALTEVDGKYTITSPVATKAVTITATDNVGNTATRTITFVEANTNSATISASITGYAAISSTDFTSGSHIYFKDNSPATPATISFATASAPACGLKDGIYNWTGSDTNGTLSEDNLKLTAEKEFTVVVVDNVGNVSSSFTITVTPDNAAPTIDGATGSTDKTYSFENTSGTWYELKDKDGNIQMALYNSTIELPSLTDGTTGVGIKYYKLVYGTTAGDEPTVPSATPLDTDWEVYDSTTPPTITLGSDAAVADGYYFLWIRDSLGNAAATKIGYKSGSSTFPIGQYKTPTTFDYTAASGKTDLTISNYPISAGIKSIVVNGPTGGNWWAYGFTTDINAVSNVLTFEKSGTTFYIDSSVTLAVWGDGNNPTSVSITDAAGYRIEKTSSGTITIYNGDTDVTSTFISSLAFLPTTPYTPATPSIPNTTPSTRGITGAVTYITQEITNFFSPKTDELPDTNTLANGDTPNEINTGTQNKKSAKKQSKATKAQTKKAEKESAKQGSGQTELASSHEVSSQTGLAAENLELVSDSREIKSRESLSNEIAPSASLEMAQAESLAEKEIIGYNYSMALVAIAVALLAAVTFGIVMLFIRRKQTKINRS